MRKFIFLAVVISTLVGCASTRYGNYSDAPSTYDQKMASDTVKQLMMLHPPAMTHIELQQATDDVYGKTLVTSLRAQGYAVTEYKPNKETKNESSQATHSKYSTRLPLGYIVDRQEDTYFYHVTVTAGNEVLSRIYTAQNKQLAPAGAWVYKEQ